MRFCRVVMPVILMSLAVFPVYGNESGTSGRSYMPQIHGTLRARYEMETERVNSRFQVRNARVSINGNVGPAIDYLMQADFCDRGSFKMLDAWIGLKPAEWLKIQAGQQRMPFSVDASRAPHMFYFSNRSFIGKQVGNVRAVGLKFRTTLPKTSAYLEAGIFNTHGITDHITWEREFTYSAKAGYVLHNVKAEIGMESVMPDSVRANLWDCSISWNCGRWMVEGEYMSKHFVHDRFRTCHAYNFMADYRMPLKNSMFNQLSFQGRFDGMTDHSSGKRNTAGLLHCTDPGRNRITVGTTLSYIKSPLRADLRLNYEKYFYHHGLDAPDGDRDKVTVELVVRF